MDVTRAKPKSSPSRSNEDWLRNIRMIINSKKWDFSVIKHLVSLNSSLINVDIFNHKTLLEVMVSDDRGTEDVVKLLIDNGADVSLASGRLLLDALRSCRYRPGIIKVLIENGVDIQDEHGGISALSEAIYEEYKVDVLRMIIDKDVDVNHVDRFGQSPICRALACGCDIEVVKLLLDCRAKVSACKCHQTPLHCLASARLIKTKVVELLLQNGIGGGGNIIIDDLERTILHNALRHATYEERAMCILVKNEIADINARDARDSTYLHDALWNPGCTLEVVKCLIEQRAAVNSVDWTGETPLHKALLIRPCNFEIVRYLLKKGSPVNVPNRAGETATVVAVKKRQNLSVIRLLMSSGERVNHPQWKSLSIAFDNFVLDRNVENIALFQTLLKYSFLENPGIDIGSMIALDRTRCVNPDIWFRFWNGCLWEIRKMATVKTWRGIPLLNILGYGTKPRLRNSYDSLSDIDNKYILLLIKDMTFPFYTEVLKAKLGYDFMIDAFAAIHLEALYQDNKNEKISVLTSQCLEYIGRFLSLDDKLRMIFLFHESFETKIKK